MKILLIGDLHGFVPRKPDFEYDCVICTGDLCDDRYIRPFLLQGWKLGATWDTYLEDSERKELLRQTISSGKRVADQLNTFGKPIYLVPGNWDVTLSKSYEKTYFGNKKRLINCEFTSFVLDDVVIVGYDASAKPEVPQRKQEIARLTTRETRKVFADYAKKYARFEKIYIRATKSEKPVILLSHNQPNRTKLDKVTNKPANIINRHLGSLIIRRIIDQYQPKLCVAGHVHETKGKTRLRKTQCINPGFRGEAYILDTTNWTIIPIKLKMQR